MATGDSLQPQPAAAPHSKPFHGLRAVARTRRLEPASPSWAGDDAKQRRHPQLVNPDQLQYSPLQHERQDGSCGEGLPLFLCSTPARRARVSHSPRNCSKLALAALRRAMATTHTPGVHSGRERRINSRSRRRMRLRSTAMPARRDVMSPVRVSVQPFSTPRVK